MGVMNEDRLTLYDGLIKTHITNTTVAKETGKGLSTNDYTTEEKTKLAGLNDTLLNKLGESTEGSLTYNGNEITSKADSELSTTSENPVQNKVITVKLNEKADSMVYDESNSKLKLMNGETVLSEVTVSGGGSASGATIGVITYESTLIGKEVVLSKDSATVKTGQFSVGGICTFSGIEEPGTYSVYSTDGTDSKTITVDITAENVVNKTVISCEFYLTPDGETITPVDDVAILLKCAEIKDKSYTTMDELLADEQAMGDITMSENAMKYLARSTGFADAVCANETFMTLLGQSAYVDATVLNSDLWVQKISSSDYYESIYDPITVHSSASATISFNGKTFTSDASGNTTKVIPWGTFTFSDSVSGQSFERTIDKNTTDLYVMPEGALYWYGNECKDVTGGWTAVSTSGSDSVLLNTNNMVIKSYDNDNSVVPTTVNKLSIPSGKTYKSRFAVSITSNSLLLAGIGYSETTPAPKAVYYDHTKSRVANFYDDKSSFENGVKEYSAISKSALSSYCIFVNLNSIDNDSVTTELYAIWIE